MLAYVHMASIREIFEQNKGLILARQPVIAPVPGAKRIPVARKLKFGTAKRALRSLLKQSGSTIHRTAPRPGYHGTYHHDTHIEVARYPGVKKAFGTLGGPVNVALHEAGHSVDPYAFWREGPITRFFRTGDENEKRNQAITVTAEVRAGSKALNALRDAGAKPPELARWRNTHNDYMKSTHRPDEAEIVLARNNTLRPPTISEIKYMLRARPWLQKKNITI